MMKVKRNEIIDIRKNSISNQKILYQGNSTSKNRLVAKFGLGGVVFQLLSINSPKKSGCGTDTSKFEKLRNRVSYKSK